MKNSIIIVLVLVLTGCSGGFWKEDDPSVGPKPDDPPLATYRIMLVSGGDVAGHDVPFIDVKANSCHSDYESEVFDGRKTPLLKVVCRTTPWIRHGVGALTNDWYIDYWDGPVVFQGLADSYQMISAGE